MVKDKCSSCLKGYDGTKGNGYQPCGCGESVVNYKEILDDTVSEVYICKETIKAMMSEEDTYHLLKITVGRLEAILQRAGVAYGK